MHTHSGVLLKMEVGIRKGAVAKGLKVPCSFTITEVSIRCPKKPEVGIRRIPAYTPPQYTSAHTHTLQTIVYQVVIMDRVVGFGRGHGRHSVVRGASYTGAVFVKFH